MTQELIYTSAPRGLKPGSRGFCTVLSTQGMPAPLAELLESLSGYRPVYPPHDANAHLNPVAWSHLRAQVGGKSYSVLSRISAYGLDYTRRTNKLAHHVVVQHRERPRGGPAAVLSRPGFMETEWTGEPRIKQAGRSVPELDGPSGICRAWHDMTGDAGWAGVLAEAFLENPDRLVYFLFEPGTDLLPLFAEAVALLPPERRWEATFSTYFTRLPPGVTCNWRCVLKGSPEARQSRRFVDALRLDLTEPLGRASGGALVERARTGRRPKSPAQPARSGTGEARRQDALDEVLEDDSPFPQAPPVAAAPGGERASYPLQAGPAGPPRPPKPPPVPERPRRRSWLTVMLLSSVALLLVGALGMGGFLVYQHLSVRQSEPVAQISELPAQTQLSSGDQTADLQRDGRSKQTTPAPNGQTIEEGGSKRSDAEQFAQAEQRREQRRAPNDRDSVPRNESDESGVHVDQQDGELPKQEVASQNQSTEGAAGDDGKSSSNGKTDGNNRKKRWKSDLRAVELPDKARDDPIVLQDFHKRPQDWELSFHPAEGMSDTFDVSHGNDRSLHVAKSAAPVSQPVAAFRIGQLEGRIDHSLYLEWKHGANYRPLVRWSVLEMNLDGRPHQFLLHEPALAPEQREFKERKLSWDLPVTGADGLAQPEFKVQFVKLRIESEDGDFVFQPTDTDDSKDRSSNASMLRSKGLENHLSQYLKDFTGTSIEIEKPPAIKIDFTQDSVEVQLVRSADFSRRSDLMSKFDDEWKSIDQDIAQLYEDLKSEADIDIETTAPTFAVSVGQQATNYHATTKSRETALQSWKRKLADHKQGMQDQRSTTSFQCRIGQLLEKIEAGAELANKLATLEQRLATAHVVGARIYYVINIGDETEEIDIINFGKDAASKEKRSSTASDS